MAAFPGKSKVYVVGLGMTKFVKPGSIPNWDYPDMVKESVTAALSDAKLQYTDVQQAVGSYIYGDSCSAQRALYTVGMTGIPIYNVNNACASGSTGLYMAKQFIESGKSDCVLAFGFEKMKTGSLDGMSRYEDRANPAERHVAVINDTFGIEPHPMTAQMFGNAGREHMQKYGTKPEHFAKIGWKNHKHSINNPRSQFRDEYTLDEILKSRMIHEPLTKLQCSPTSDGSAAAIICSENFLRTHPHLKKQAVEILGMQMATDFPSAFSENSNLKMIGYDMVKHAADNLYKEVGFGPEHVQVIECHDCFSANELIAYEALSLCAPGKAGELIDRGDNTYGGKWVVNPSGGLISKGHPIGATGIAQCAELCWQLRGLAGKRQVPNVKVALQHNIGIGGAVVLSMYKLAFPEYPSASTGPSTTVSRGITSAPDSNSFTSDIVFNEIKERASSEGAEYVKNVGGTYRFNVSKGTTTKNWTVDLTKEPIFVGTRDGKVDVELTIADTDLFDIVSGKSTVEKLFMSGKLKLKGNMAKAMKLRQVLDVKKLKSKL
jgi:sterol carrier protein 2